nr:exportin-7 [Quercus suber]
MKALLEDTTEPQQSPLPSSPRSLRSSKHSFDDDGIPLTDFDSPPHRKEMKPVEVKIDGNYLRNYLATRGPDVEPFVVGSLIQLLCVVTKFGWPDDDRFKEVMKFLSQPNSGLPSMLEHKIAISFKDQSVFQAFESLMVTRTC